MFLSNFIDFSGPRYHQSRLSLKPDSNDLVFHPKHTHGVCGITLIVSRQYDWKCLGQILTTFLGPDTTVAGKFENRTRMTILQPKHTNKAYVVVLIISRQLGCKIFRLNFNKFSWPEHHKNRPAEGKVENRARITQFLSRNIPTLLVVPFLLFPINTTE